MAQQAVDYLEREHERIKTVERRDAAQVVHAWSSPGQGPSPEAMERVNQAIAKARRLFEEEQRGTAPQATEPAANQQAPPEQGQQPEVAPGQATGQAGTVEHQPETKAAAEVLSQASTTKGEPDMSRRENYENLMRLLAGGNYSRVEPPGFYPLEVERFEGGPHVSLYRIEGQREYPATGQEAPPLPHPVGTQLVFRVEGEEAKPVCSLSSVDGTEEMCTEDEEGHWRGRVALRPERQKNLDRRAALWWQDLRQNGYFEHADAIAMERAQKRAAMGAREAAHPASAPTQAPDQAEATEPAAKRQAPPKQGQQPEVSPMQAAGQAAAVEHQPEAKAEAAEEARAGERPKNTYTVRVVEQCRLWGDVTVQAASQAEAEELAGENFVPSWEDSAVEGRETRVLTENGVPVEFDWDGFEQTDVQNPYRKVREHGQEAAEAQCPATDPGQASKLETDAPAMEPHADFRMEYLGAGDWRFTPLTPKAREFTYGEGVNERFERWDAAGVVFEHEEADEFLRKLERDGWRVETPGHGPSATPQQAHQPAPGPYRYQRGKDGCDETWDIYGPDSKHLVSIPFWDDAAGAEAEARLIVNSLNVYSGEVHAERQTQAELPGMAVTTSVGELLAALGGNPERGPEQNPVPEGGQEEARAKPAREAHQEGNPTAAPVQAAGESLMKLTEDEFVTRYPLVRNHINQVAVWTYDDGQGCMFETHGPESEFVMRQDPRRVWTLLDAGDGEYIQSGLHLVNRLGHFVSTEQVPEGVSVEVDVSTPRKPDLTVQGGTTAGEQGPIFACAFCDTPTPLDDMLNCPPPGMCTERYVRQPCFEQEPKTYTVSVLQTRRTTSEMEISAYCREDAEMLAEDRFFDFDDWMSGRIQVSATAWEKGQVKPHFVGRDELTKGEGPTLGPHHRETIREVVDYLWEDERADYADNPSRDHIYTRLTALRELCGLEDLGPEVATQQQTEAEAPAKEHEREPTDRDSGGKTTQHRFSSGAVRGYLWDNGPDQEATLTVGRVYQSGEGWQWSQSFRARDAEDLVKVTQDAGHALGKDQAKDRDEEREL
jgi:hypothetical protein